MEKIKKNWIRVTYFIVSIAVAILGYIFNDLVLSKTATPLDKFSYIGTIATHIGLLIAVSEIFHSIKVSQELKSETSKLLQKIRNFDYAALTIQCQHCLDDASQLISTENYSLALKAFQYFRITYSKFSLEIQERDTINSILKETESTIHIGLHSSTASPLSSRQRKLLVNNILTIKDVLQKEFPQHKEDYVSAEN